MTTQVDLDLQECTSYLDALYPDQEALPAGYYVASWPVTGTGARMHSRWFAASQRRALLTFLTEHGQQHNVYLALGFRSHLCTPAQHRRGTSEEVVAIPGLWVELDHNAGRHAAKGLPDPQTLRDWMFSLPWTWSLIIDSTGGYHGYVLFKEPLLLTTDLERQAARSLVSRFQATLKALAPAAWTIDPTADLARVLRPPGTYNQKSGTPRRVSILHENANRMDPEELLEAPWLVADPTPAAPDPLHSTGVADPNLVVAGCAWLRHCRDEAADLPEPHWYTMLEIVGRCHNGPVWVHDWSAPYPGYNAKETDAKLRYALAKGSPKTCAYIRAKLDGEPFCSGCVHWGQIKSPLSLGFRPARNGTVPGPEPETLWTFRELPDSARLDPAIAAGASLWLDEFVQFARHWSPRGYSGLFEAIAMWTLAVVAARRIRINWGTRPLYPSLYIAMVARSGMYAKTATTDVARTMLRNSGLEWLLGEDEATPQAFIQARTLAVPANYADMSTDDQEMIQHQLAFSAQRGWFYEEFGQHLDAMMRREGVMSGFRKLLREVYDNPTQFSYRTISRGVERIVKPYLALLANSTPADLAPFLRPNSPLWRDGYMARFLISSPGDEPPKDDLFPMGEMWSSVLQRELHDFHVRLGAPAIDLFASDKDDHKFIALLKTPLPETIYTMSDDVMAAYNAYDKALRALLFASKNENLDASYIRMPHRVLRIALLLAALHDTGEHCVHLQHWARGQAIVETGREGLHHLIGSVAKERQGEESAPQRKEKRIIQALIHHGGPVSQRDLQRLTHLSHQEIVPVCQMLEQAGMLERTVKGRTVMYRMLIEDDTDDDS